MKLELKSSIAKPKVPKPDALPTSMQISSIPSLNAPKVGGGGGEVPVQGSTRKVIIHVGSIGGSGFSFAKLDMQKAEDVRHLLALTNQQHVEIIAEMGDGFTTTYKSGLTVWTE